MRQNFFCFATFSDILTVIHDFWSNIAVMFQQLPQLFTRPNTANIAHQQSARLIPALCLLYIAFPSKSLHKGGKKTYLHFFISTNGNYLLTIFRVKHAIQTLKSHKTLRCKHTCRYPVWQTICNPTSQDLLWRLAHTVSRTLLTDLLYNDCFTIFLCQVFT